MAKKSSIEKQKLKEKLVQQNWQKRQELKKQVMDLRLSEEEKEKARLALNKLSRRSSPVQLRNRCQLTGRARAYLRKFKLSRLTFRKMALEGKIPGIVKASW